MLNTSLYINCNLYYILIDLSIELYSWKILEECWKYIYFN